MMGRGGVLFSTLQITDGVWKDEAVARADRLNHAAGNVVIATA